MRTVFNWAYTFNTNAGSWSNETFRGALPSTRIGHTAHLRKPEADPLYIIILHWTLIYVYLVPNSRDIIIYGGSDGNEETGKALTDYCFTLNLISNTWTKQGGLDIPSILSGPRFTHACMITKFGFYVVISLYFDI